MKPSTTRTENKTATGEISASIMANRNEMRYWMERTLLCSMPDRAMRKMAESLDGYQEINPITFGEGMGLLPSKARHVAEFGTGESPTIRILRELFPTNKTIWDAYVVLRRMNSRAAGVLEDLWNETCQAHHCGTSAQRPADVDSEPSRCGCGQCYNDLNMESPRSSGFSNSRYGAHGINIRPSPPPPFEDDTELKGASPASGEGTQCSEDSEFSPPEDMSDRSLEEIVESLGRFGDSADNEDWHLAQSFNLVPQNGREGPHSFPLGVQQQHRNVPASNETHHSLPDRCSKYVPGLEHCECQRTAEFSPPATSHELPARVKEEMEFQQGSDSSPEGTAAAAAPTPRAESGRQGVRRNPAGVRRGRIFQGKFVLVVCGEKHWSDAHEGALRKLLDTLKNNAIPYVVCSPGSYLPWSWSPETLVSEEVIMQDRSFFLHKVFEQASAIIPVITRKVQRYVEPSSQRSMAEARENAIYIFRRMLSEITMPAGNTRFFPLIMDQLGASSRHNFDWLKNTIVYSFSAQVQRRDLLCHISRRLNP